MNAQKSILTGDAFASPYPRSICLCGHTGDGRNSEHGPTLAPGHGPCTVAHCGCERFSWAKFIKDDAELKRAVTLARDIEKWEATATRKGFDNLALLLQVVYAGVTSGVKLSSAQQTRLFRTLEQIIGEAK